ncbi:hypothetical protein [Hubei virga-like virus 12]|uniref:hypothetical protein n=1 Tax=Hubei virga-like virus 12 TaxID=1923327 RepID=UPI00090BF478|nr:hypothetical protein [Hubei virga-like virus 12]APG77685.1 hypothetical protein [Hubei virga-like virus 12]
MINCIKNFKNYNIRKFTWVFIYFVLLWNLEETKSVIILFLIFNQHLLHFNFKRNFISCVNIIFNNMYTKYIKEFTHTFVIFNDYIFFINSIKPLRFNLKENRDQIRDNYSNLLSKAIAVDINTRFDEEFILIDLDNWFNSKVLNSLLNSIDTADRFFDNSEFLITQSHHLNDASKNFQNCKNRLQLILNLPVQNYRNYGIYNRCNFEENFSLTWKILNDTPVCSNFLSNLISSSTISNKPSSKD